MRIFVSAGEPSGDLHGANLIHSLRRLHPNVEIVGFGGDRMAAAGAELLYPLCQLSVMWFLRVILNIHLFLDLLSKADRYFKQHRPDAVVLIDYPGFHWWLARRAHFHGIPVYYFVPPQLWGWAGWRVEKMRRWVDHVLCALPFEEAWYRERGVAAHYVGHPYFDELAEQPCDAAFIAQQQARPEKIVAILPGSRNQEIHNNLSTQVRAAARIHAARPDVRFLMACYKESQRAHVAAYVRKKNLPIEVHVGRTPEIIRLADACLAVSGSVSLELLYQLKPTVIVYRVSPLDLKVGKFFKTSRYITLVNLLADAELYPEFLTDHCEAEGMANHVLRWLNEPEQHEALRQRLREVRDRVAEPGACDRAAQFVLAALAALARSAA
ncbi:MAG: lipid-A-disaccharide synthase [Planctomycetia bacterium]|nr:lipid-A-disaccharide synthase [Planctomycetia bacterium]